MHELIGKTPAILKNSSAEADKASSLFSQYGVTDQKNSNERLTGSRFDFSNIAVNYGGRMLQTKLNVNKPGDKYEQEADAVADKIIRMNETNAVQRKCAKCEEEEEKLQRKPLSQNISSLAQAAGENISSSLDNVINSSKGGGRRMDNNTQSFMSTRFGINFNHVKIHDDDQAAKMTGQLHARAFTVGNDIYFNYGQYQPRSQPGKHLLAHELTHVLQQQKGEQIIQQDGVKDPLEKEAHDLETEILGKTLGAEEKKKVKEIIRLAKAKPLGKSSGQRNYYLEKLKVAVTSPVDADVSGKKSKTGYNCTEAEEKKNRKKVEKALEEEKRWWEGSGFENVEENAVATGTKKIARIGEQGKKFYVDRSDPKNIRVKIKVKLNGKADEVKSIKKLEDAIERKSHTKGYYLDIEFVDKSGPEVFEIKVAFCEWANSGNWASSPTDLSHEVHHALGLDDRYDYIEAHVARSSMSIDLRLHWFLEQMKKTKAARDPYSKMAVNKEPLLAEDVCAVAFKPGPDRTKCIKERKDLDPPGIPPN